MGSAGGTGQRENNVKLKSKTEFWVGRGTEVNGSRAVLETGMEI